MAEEEDDHVDGEAVDEVAEAPEDGARLRVPIDGVNEELIDVILENDVWQRIIIYKELRNGHPRGTVETG